MMTLLLAPVPVLIVLALTLLTALPWSAHFGNAFGAAGSFGAAPDYAAQALATAAALLPVSAIYFWSVRRPQLMPAGAAFACGLVLDVLTQGPLGVWSVAALLAASMGRRTRRAEPRYGWLRSAIHLAMALAGAAALVGGLLSLYAWQVVPLRPLGVAAAATVLAYPLLAGVLRGLDRLWPPAAERSLFLRKD